MEVGIRLYMHTALSLVCSGYSCMALGNRIGGTTHRTQRKRTMPTSKVQQQVMKGPKQNKQARPHQLYDWHLAGIRVCNAALCGLWDTDQTHQTPARFRPVCPACSLLTPRQDYLQHTTFVVQRLLRIGRAGRQALGEDYLSSLQGWSASQLSGLIMSRDAQTALSYDLDCKLILLDLFRICSSRRRRHPACTCWLHTGLFRSLYG